VIWLVGHGENGSKETNAESKHANDPKLQELANDPKLKNFARLIITRNGYECPEVKNLWPGGVKPMGTWLEALCGPGNNDTIHPALHYAVFPDQMKATVCKPFSFSPFSG
jgi:hypothetical protein